MSICSYSELTVQRGDHGGSTDTDTSNETPYVDSGDLSGSCCLHNRAENGHKGSNDQVPPPADLVSNETGSESADKTTTLQGGDNVCLKVRKRNANFFREAVVSTNRVRSARGCGIVRLALERFPWSKLLQ